MLNQRDVVPEHAALPALIKRLGASRCVEVARVPSTRYRASQCYWNVAEHVSTYGGVALYGWMVIEIPAVALLAWHHAIWIRSATEMIDISPSPLTGYAQGTTVFVVDSQQGYDISWPLAMPQVFLPLDGSAIVEEFVESYNKLFRLQREHLCRQRAIPTAVYCNRTSSVRTDTTEAAQALRNLDALYKPLIDIAKADHDTSLARLRDKQAGA